MVEFLDKIDLSENFATEPIVEYKLEKNGNDL